MAHVIVLLSRVHPVNYKPFRMSHHVSISNCILIDYSHYLLWLNLYLWQMQIPLLIDCDSKSPLLVLCEACDLSNTITQRRTAKTSSNSLQHVPCHALIPAFNILTSDRSRGGSGGDFNTKLLLLSLRACATAYQLPLSDVGNPAPCPPNLHRPDCLFCPNQIENYRTDTAMVYFNGTLGSLCPLCG